MAKVTRRCAPGNFPFPETEPRAKAAPAPSQETTPVVDQSEKKMLQDVEAAVIQAKAVAALPKSSQTCTAEMIEEVKKRVTERLAEIMAARLSTSTTVTMPKEEPSIKETKPPLEKLAEASTTVTMPKEKPTKIYKVREPESPPGEGFEFLCASACSIENTVYSPSAEDEYFWKAVQKNLEKYGIFLKEGENPWDSNNLIQLRSLVLTACELKRVPLEINRFINIESLVLNGNPELVLGEHVFTLPKLKEISVDEGIRLPKDLPKHLQIHYS